MDEHPYSWGLERLIADQEAAAAAKKHQRVEDLRLCLQGLDMLRRYRVENRHWHTDIVADSLIRHIDETISRMTKEFQDL